MHVHRLPRQRHRARRRRRRAPGRRGRTARTSSTCSPAATTWTTRPPPRAPRPTRSATSATTGRSSSATRRSASTTSTSRRERVVLDLPRPARHQQRAGHDDQQRAPDELRQAVRHAEQRRNPALRADLGAGRGALLPHLPRPEPQPGQLLIGGDGGLRVTGVLSICPQGGQAKVTRGQMETPRAGPAARTR